MRIYTIYKATNLINGKCYVGFDSKWPGRKSSHKCNATKHIENFPLYNSIRKYGWDSFIWEVLYQSYDKMHTLKVMEEHFIRENHSHWTEHGYNLTFGGEGNTSVGRKLSEKHKEAIRLSKVGKPRSEETKEKLRRANLGKVGTPHILEHKEYISNLMKTNTKPCPHCGKYMNPGNLKRHLNKV